MKKKAISLISGGLDSLLATKLIMDQGIEVIGISFLMQIAYKDICQMKSRILGASKEINIVPCFFDISKEFLNVVKDPKYGYGAHINPCIDCKILMLKHAKKIMEEKECGFIITGDVLGERPMSQTKYALDLIQRKSNVTDYLLRPLSALCLKPSLPEINGIVKRDKLLDIKGRSRKKQFELANKYKLSKFFAPGGGCLLTDINFSRRLTDLIKRNQDNVNNIELLKYGRHFRLDEFTKIVIGRNERENEIILKLKKNEDIVFYTKDNPGPTALLKGKIIEKNIKKVAQFVIGYSKMATGVVEYYKDCCCKNVINVFGLELFQMEKLKI